MSALEQVKAFAKKELRAGRQISWNVAFATTRPALKHIRAWYAECPAGLSKAEAVEWLARLALEEINAERATKEPTP